MVNTSRPNCLYLFLMGMRSKRQDRIHTSPCRYKLHATLAVAHETPRLLAIIEMMPAIKSYNIFMFLLFYVRIYFKVQHIPLIIRDFLSAKVGINMHALVLFICGLYQMPASVYELMVQLFPMVLLFHSLYHHFCYLSESLSCHASSGSWSLWSYCLK